MWVKHRMTRDLQDNAKEFPEYESRTLDLSLAAWRLDSSNSSAPPAEEVAPLHDSGVVGLARVDSAVLTFFGTGASGLLTAPLDDRRWRTLQSSREVEGPGGATGERWRRRSISATAESSDRADFIHWSSSWTIVLYVELCRERKGGVGDTERERERGEGVRRERRMGGYNGDSKGKWKREDEKYLSNT